MSNFLSLPLLRRGSDQTELLQLFYDAFPEAVEHTSRNGQLPLHAACDKCMHPRIILFFLNTYPQAAAVKEEQSGWQPLAYYLLRSQPYKGVVKGFVNAAPSSIEHDYEFRSNNNQPTALPNPLCLALSKRYNDSILKMLVPTNPESLCLVLEHEFHNPNLVESITVERANMIATKVSSWIETLQLDTKWFNREGLVAFFSKLTETHTASLKILDIHIASNVFGNANVRNALSQLLRQSPNLRDVRVRKPRNGTGPSNDDPFLSALAAGLIGHEAFCSLGLSRLRGRTFAGLRKIMGDCPNLKYVAIADSSFTREGVQMLFQGIHENNVLKSAQIDLCKMPVGGLNRVLEALSSIPTVNVLRLAPYEADGLPSLSRMTNLKHILLTMDSEGDLYNHGPTNSLLALLESSTNLKRLDVSYLHLPAERLSDVLKQNRTLRCLKIHGCSNTNKLVKEIS